MRYPPCGSPSCTRPVKTGGVTLLLRTQYGREVTIIMHETCANDLMGQTALQMRRLTMALDHLVEKARYEARSVVWDARSTRALRLRLEMTQAEFGKEIGASRQAVCRHEMEDSPPWYGKSHIFINLEIAATRRTGQTLNEWMEDRNGTSNVRRDARELDRQRQGAVRAHRRGA